MQPIPADEDDRAAQDAVEGTIWRRPWGARAKPRAERGAP